MNKINKKLLIFSLLLLFFIVLLALGLKYFPFTKVVKMPAGSEKEFVNPENSHDRSPHTLYYDFEVAPGKDMPDGFYKGIAHSGQYAVKAFGKNSFSKAVERTAGEVGVENLKAVAISAWIYVFPTKDEVKGSLVFTASNEVGVNVCWLGIGIVEPEVPRGKWFKISKYFDLTAFQFKPDYKIQVYFWNNSSTDILVDDYFIAFGGATDRRGDSARVDMTKPAGYVPKFNFPPFPVTLLEKVPFEKTIDPADVDSNDFLLAGNFLNTGNDALIMVGKDGKPAIYAVCPGNREFRKIVPGNPSVMASVGPVKKILKGKFLPTSADQLILVGEKGWMLCAFNPPDNICNNNGTLQTTINVLWQSDTPAGSIYTGDFTGNHKSAVLWIDNNGSWKVMSFENTNNSGSKWRVIARDDNKPQAEWDLSTQEAGISVGHFLPGMAKDVVLTVTRNKSNGKIAYTLRKFNLPGKKWDPVFSEKQQYLGKTIGLDTLKPSDLFFETSPDGNKTAIFRYNRDWRYDLKEIRFNDTTFGIVSNVDFHGYNLDQNPKYYEALNLVPGCFLNPSSASFLTVGTVLKNRHYQAILPDFVHLYSPSVNK
jgi:hypothetical protein